MGGSLSACARARLGHGSTLATHELEHDRSLIGGQQLEQLAAVLASYQGRTAYAAVAAAAPAPNAATGAEPLKAPRRHRTHSINLPPINLETLLPGHSAVSSARPASASPESPMKRARGAFA